MYIVCTSGDNSWGCYWRALGLYGQQCFSTQTACWNHLEVLKIYSCQVPLNCIQGITLVSEFHRTVWVITFVCKVWTTAFGKDGIWWICPRRYKWVLSHENKVISLKDSINMDLVPGEGGDLFPPLYKFLLSAFHILFLSMLNYRPQVFGILKVMFLWSWDLKVARYAWPTELYFSKLYEMVKRA